ncbi:acyltransferase family protein [Pelagibacterium sp. H642]|uniref:acyltransferase family protein n=1 Tax=Pelagibacterium sp. H642 TaxID=1881069 RepID=UPI0028166665|nr:acyltransferase family protein [Pelagibacterium sp. H642]WMT90975.1 acyltransferase [Pelagibacterium sp. H642]
MQQPMEPESSYRKDIDGLRAVAVLLVVFYHYGISPFTGGFVGVDVFFVISGYVITSKIRRETASGTFSLRGFYIGRARRLLPALIVMIAVSLLAGWFLLMPSDYQSLGQQAAYAAVGISNFYFLGNSGYFSRAADLLPLLHTWSLGVEEQFYLLWPLLLLLVTRKALSDKLSILALSALIIVSLALSIVIVANNQPTAFYMLHTRAWELAIGGLIAFMPRLRWSTAPNIIGMVLIIAGAVLLDARSPFPGALAIPVCIGSALLVWPKANPDVIADGLSSRPMVGLGKLSYSLYLWHWPILAFYRHWNFEQEPDRFTASVLILLSLVAAWLSWRFVEKPFRKPTDSPIRLPPLIPVGSATAILIGVLVMASSGFPSRLPAEALTIAAGAADVSPLRSSCHRTNFRENTAVAESCIMGDTNSIPHLLLWGDSHGVELSYWLGQHLATTQQSLRSVTYSGCPPGLYAAISSRPNCPAHNEAVLDYILSDDSTDQVLLVGRYSRTFQEDPGDFTRGMIDAVSALAAAGKEVSILTPIPEYPSSIPHVIPQMMLRKAASEMTLPIDAYQRENGEILSLLERLGKVPGVTLIRATEALCPNGICQSVEDGHSLYFDEHHLSNYGAQLLVQRTFGAQSL